MNRKIFVIVSLLLALALLAGCSMPPQSVREGLKATEAPQAEAPVAATEAPQPEESAALPETTEGSASAEAALEALFEELRGRVFPGTAGSSLSAAACAGALADLFTDSGLSPDAVDGAVRRYRDALSEEDAALFEMQLDAVVAAFSHLTAEGGEGLLSDCGYESAHYPWSEGNVRDCFVALLGSD